MPLVFGGNDAVEIRNLTPSFKMCCEDTAPCVLCLVIDTKISFHPDKDMEDEDHSGHDEEDYSESKGINSSSIISYHPDSSWFHLI